MKTEDLVLKTSKVSMKKIEDIDNEIAVLEKKINEVKGTETEVYTRIVGYHRSVSNWNNGKREEYGDRVTFNLDINIIKSKLKNSEKNNEPNTTLDSNKINICNSSNVAFYKVFHSQFCRNCPPVLDFVKSLPVPGEEIDVSTDLGLNSARKYNIMSTPSVVLFDKEDKVMAVLNSLEQLKEIFEDYKQEMVSA